MPVYQTKVYQFIPDSEPKKEFGYVLFVSNEYDNPADAMKEFNKFPEPQTPWMASILVIENGNIIEEDTFSSSIKLQG